MAAKKKTEVKKELVDLYIYKKRSSGSTVYMSNEMPKFDPNSGLSSDGSEADICSYGLMSFGLTPNDVSKHGRVIKLQIEIHSRQQCDHNVEVKQTDFVKAELKRTLEELEDLREARRRRRERMNHPNQVDEDEADSTDEDDA